MDAIVIIIGLAVIWTGLLAVAKRAVHFGYTYYLAYRLLREAREDQDKEVSTLLNEQGY